MRELGTCSESSLRIAGGQFLAGAQEQIQHGRVVLCAGAPLAKTRGAPCLPMKFSDHGPCLQPFSLEV